MAGDYVTPKQRAAYFSAALGREITYKQVSFSEKYNMLVQHLPHYFAYNLACGYSQIKRTDSLSILLGRKPETLEHWIHANKDAFL